MVRVVVVESTVRACFKAMHRKTHQIGQTVQVIPPSLPPTHTSRSYPATTLQDEELVNFSISCYINTREYANVFLSLG